MLCSEFDARMQELLDQRKSPELDPAVLGHTQNCPNCNAQLVTLSSLLDSLDLLEVPELSPEFAHRVVQSLATPTPASSPARPRSSWLLAAIAIAAVLLLTAVPLTWYALKGGQTLAQPTTRTKPFSEASRAESAVQQPHADTVRESWLVPVAILELYPEETRERHRQQVNQIADDLRPIATPFNATVTAIRRSIPVGQAAAKGEPRASLQRPSHTRDLS